VRSSVKMTTTVAVNRRSIEYKCEWYPTCPSWSIHLERDRWVY